MKKQVLFLFHGMGNHARARVGEEDDSWADPIAAALDGAAKSYDALKDGLSGWVDIVPITYDQVFHTLLERWNRSAASLRAAMGDAKLAKVFGWLDGITGGGASNLFWTHIADVLLWRFSQARDEVLARVLEKMVDRIVSELNAVDWDLDQVEFSVLAHSLGTSVAHDALHRLATVPIPDRHGVDNTALQPPNFRFKSFIAIANMSRVLFPGDDRLETVTRVRPRAEGLAPARYYLDGHFINFRHVADPVPSFWRFRPSGWEGRYIAKKVRHYRSFDIASFQHYLKHPQISGLTLYGILGDELITRDEFNEITGRFEDCKAPGAELKQKIIAAAERAIGALSGESALPEPDEAIYHIATQMLDWRNQAAAVE